ncbi:hypothetical protein HYX02_06170, partial [Candidatus Woesearchaeota archaeon]|nr:hypothetical protein [Candidatus Woesearchaeota archaeon]
MTHESKDDAFLEKVILFLVIVVGAVLVFNQFQFAKLSSNIFLSSISFLLILVLIGLVVWLFLKKEKHEHEEHHAEPIVHEKVEKKPLTFHEKLSWGFVAFIAVLILFNQIKISQVNALTSGTSSPLSSFVKSASSGTLKLGSGKSGIVIGPQLNPDGRTTKLV